MTESLEFTDQKYMDVNSISKSYGLDASPVLDNISFKISKRSITSILGPNGCGKTTLLSIIAGLTNPDSGGIFINGKKTIENNLGMIFQDYNSTLMPWAKCIDNIGFPLKLKGMNKSEYRKQVKEFVTKELSLDIPFEKYPYQCSGGQKQMIAIARALIVKPTLFLLDEPFSSLDYSIKLQLENKLLNIWDKLKNTILMISHDIDESIFLSDTVIILSKKPSRIVDIIPIDLPRPRDLTVRTDEKFQQIRSIVYDKFLKSLH